MQKLSVFFLLIFSLVLSGCTRKLALESGDSLGQSVYHEVAKSGLPWTVFAQSAEKRDIYILEIGTGDSTTIIFGGFHGNEILGVQLVLKFAAYLYQEQQPPPNTHVIIVPVLNPDGLVRVSRRNANNVDINRNFPTHNWTAVPQREKYHPGPSPASEPETRAALALLTRYSPRRIISVHTPLKMVNYDGPAKALAEDMGRHNGYTVSADIGYPTPGSFGTYAGKAQNIPTITLELYGE